MSNPSKYPPPSHLEQSSSSSFEERLKNKHIRSMPVGNDRLAALRDLGVTFDEGHHKTTKIATPSGTPKIPTFVDANQIERLLQQNSSTTSNSTRSPFSASTMTSRADLGMFGEWR